MANSHTEMKEAPETPIKSDDFDGKYRKPAKRKNPTSNLTRKQRAVKRKKRNMSR
tara:strand:- start:2752 stop:2916 length:165 start_codon:yes stop_codon:yes gene_type:complete